VKVEVTDGHLAISGERKTEAEEKKLEDVKATFSDGVLEVGVPLPAKPEAKARKVEIQEAAKTAKTAA
jgi:HSP20 family molecular chaperone IbpA